MFAFLIICDEIGNVELDEKDFDFNREVVAREIAAVYNYAIS